MTVPAVAAIAAAIQSLFANVLFSNVEVETQQVAEMRHEISIYLRKYYEAMRRET